MNNNTEKKQDAEWNHHSLEMFWLQADRCIKAWDEGIPSCTNVKMMGSLSGLLEGTSRPDDVKWVCAKPFLEVAKFVAYGAEEKSFKDLFDNLTQLTDWQWFRERDLEWSEADFLIMLTRIHHEVASPLRKLLVSRPDESIDSAALQSLRTETGRCLRNLQKWSKGNIQGGYSTLLPDVEELDRKLEACAGLGGGAKEGNVLSCDELDDVKDIMKKPGTFEEARLVSLLPRLLKHVLHMVGGDIEDSSSDEEDCESSECELLDSGKAHRASPIEGNEVAGSAASGSAVCVSTASGSDQDEEDTFEVGGRILCHKEARNSEFTKKRDVLLAEGALRFACRKNTFRQVKKAYPKEFKNLEDHQLMYRFQTMSGARSPAKFFQRSPQSALFKSTSTAAIQNREDSAGDRKRKRSAEAASRPSKRSKKKRKKLRRRRLESTEEEESDCDC